MTPPLRKLRKVREIYLFKMRCEKAFSLIELIVVVVILLVILSIILLSIPKARMSSQVKLQAQTLVSDFRLAKSTAMAEGSSKIDFSASGFYLIVDSTGEVKGRTSYYEGVNIVFPSGSRIYNFNQSGAADHGGSFQITANGANNKFTVTLTPSTGMITLLSN